MSKAHNQHRNSRFFIFFLQHLSYNVPSKQHVSHVKFIQIHDSNQTRRSFKSLTLKITKTDNGSGQLQPGVLNQKGPAMCQARCPNLNPPGDVRWWPFCWLKGCFPTLDMRIIKHSRHCLSWKSVTFLVLTKKSRFTYVYIIVIPDM